MLSLIGGIVVILVVFKVIGVLTDYVFKGTPYKIKGLTIKDKSDDVKP